MKRSPLATLALAAAVGAALAAAAAPAAEAGAPAPLIPGYGDIVPLAITGRGEAPDPSIDYKVVMGLNEPDQVYRAVRFLNLLAAAGVPAGHRHLVVVLHGRAVNAALKATSEAGRPKTPDPYARPVAAVAALVAAGVSVRVCGQALAASGIAHDQVIPGVEVDYSALTTLATLQLKGYALLPTD